MDAADRVGQTARRGGLQHVTGGAGIERAAQVAGPGEGRQDHDPRRPSFVAQPLRQLQPRHLRHLDVGDDDIGPQRPGEIEPFAPVARGADHFDVALDLEQCGKRSGHHRLILGDQHADHAGGSRDAGSVTWIATPCRASTLILPPADAMRSRMPDNPWPSRSGPPWPSSATVRTTRSSSARSSTRQAPARA